MAEYEDLPASNWTPAEKKMHTSESALQDLKDKYKNPLHPISFLGVEKIYKFYNGILQKNKIRKYLNSTEVSTIMRLQPRNRPKIFTPIISFHHLDLVQMDLIDVSRLSSENDGHNFLFCVIDVFSRVLYVQPLKNKQALSVVPSLKDVLMFMEHLPTNITSDAGGIRELTVLYTCINTYFSCRRIC